MKIELSAQTEDKINQRNRRRKKEETANVGKEICSENRIWKTQRRMKIIVRKAIRLQAWRGPVGSRWLRFPDFKTIGT